LLIAANTALASEEKLKDIILKTLLVCRKHLCLIHFDFGQLGQGKSNTVLSGQGELYRDAFVLTPPVLGANSYQILNHGIRN
jgi:hypothetical protein